MVTMTAVTRMQMRPVRIKSPKLHGIHQRVAGANLAAPSTGPEVNRSFCGCLEISAELLRHGYLLYLSGPSARAGASWSMDSSSDDSHRWSDTLSVDEKDGFVFVNYSEGQAKVPHPHPSNPGQSCAPQPFQPPNTDAHTYNQLRTGVKDIFP